MAATIDLTDFLEPDQVAEGIADYWNTWDNMRVRWMDQKREVQEYIFATSTTTTTNRTLPWKNKVHIPKLCQIRDNLHANYMATLFPSDNYMVWEGDTVDTAQRDKAKTIQSYMTNKLSKSKFRTEVSKLILDFIDCGNVFAMTSFEAEYTTDPVTGEKHPVYVGPRLSRIAPEDIVFDPTATTFEKSPKIIRSLKTLGTIKKEIATQPELGYMEDVFEKALDVRHRMGRLSKSDFKKSAQFNIDGFAGFWDYFNSGYVEVLNFYGDYYDAEKDKLYENHMITVIDRSYVLRLVPLDNWLGYAPIRHAGWRLRQDSLYAMGPLDNLIGLQYRIDHLENCKADAWDQFIHPMPVITGDVADFEFGPGERIYAGDEGTVTFLRPDPQFLTADNQIEMYERKMEEMAGAPKEAAGFRTPGEKTAFEVQVLENGANKVFVNKVSYFEEVFLEPCVNDMLEAARRNLNEADTIRVIDDATQAVIFQSITKEDITGSGKIKPMGARHFAQNATMLQNLVQFSNSPLAQDPTIISHISGKRMAVALEQLLGLEKFHLVQDNIRIYEQGELSEVQGSIEQAMVEKQTAGMDPAMVQQMLAQQAEQQGKGSPNGQPQA